MALSKLAEVSEKKTPAVDLIVQALRDPQFRFQLTALDAASTLGDPRVVGALSSTPFVDGRLRRAAKETARSLRESGGAHKEVTALRGELDKLKGETRALKERLDVLDVKKKKGSSGRTRK